MHSECQEQIGTGERDLQSEESDDSCYDSARRIAELKNALHGLVARVERVGGYATPEEQETLWRAKEALNRESVIYTTESVRKNFNEYHGLNSELIADAAMTDAPAADPTAWFAVHRRRLLEHADEALRGRPHIAQPEDTGDAAAAEAIEADRVEARDQASDAAQSAAETRAAGAVEQLSGDRPELDDGIRDTVRELWNAEFEPRARTEPPWEQLDSGIRDTVRALWDAGFEPTDSGDGRKAGEMDCAIETAHVFMRCDPGRLVAEAERLARLVEGWPAVGDYEVHDQTSVSPEHLAKSWLVRAQDRVARLSREPARKQPSFAVVESVRALLSLLYLANMKPSRIVATADGGISLWFI